MAKFWYFKDKKEEKNDTNKLHFSKRNYFKHKENFPKYFFLICYKYLQ